MNSDLQKKVEDFIEMERRSCSMDLSTPIYVARSLQVSVEDAIHALKVLGE